MKLRFILAIFLTVSGVSTHALNPDGFETFTHFGHIYAQTVVNTADGKPIWAEYNKQGGHTRLHELDGEVGQVLAARQVESFFALLDNFKSQYNNDVEILSTDEFGSQLLTSDGRAISWPNLPQGASTLVLPSQSQRHSTDGEQLDKLVFPIDLNSVTSQNLSGYQTLLFDNAGQLKYSSPERI